MTQYTRPEKYEHWRQVFGMSERCLRTWFKTGIVDAKKVGARWAVAVHELPFDSEPAESGRNRQVENRVMYDSER